MYRCFRTREQDDTPPGKGTKSTKDRNLRRRAARKALAVAQKKAVGQQIRLNRGTNVNEGAEIVQGGNLTEDLVGTEVEVEVNEGIALPAATASSNKRGSYLSEMQGKTGKKMIYSLPVQGEAAIGVVPLRVAAQPETPARNTSAAESPLPKHLHTLPNKPPTPSRSPYATPLPPLPPSQMRNLASNLIISQQWYKMESKQEAAKARKNAMKRARNAADVSVDVDGEDAAGILAVNPPAVVGESPLEKVRKSSDELTQADWEVIETKWEDLPIITEGIIARDADRVLAFKVSVGWHVCASGYVLSLVLQALELDQYTWQPAIMTKIGKVISTDESGNITLKMFKRPRPAEYDYGDKEQGEQPLQGEEEEGEEEEDVIVPKATVLDGSYRLLRPHIP